MFLKSIVKKLDKPADFIGQELSKKLMIIIFGLGYTISVILGYALNDLKYTLYFATFSFALAFIVCVPSWPMFRKNPVKLVSAKKKKE